MRKGETAWMGEGQRERETQNLKQASGSELSAQSPTQGSNSWIVRSWPEPKSDTTDWATQASPDLPVVCIFFWFFGNNQAKRKLENESTCLLKSEVFHWIGVCSFIRSFFKCLFIYLNFFFKHLFIFETERDRAWTGEEQRERETQNLKQAPGSELSAQSPTRGSNSRTVRSWPEPKSDA